QPAMFPKVWSLNYFSYNHPLSGVNWYFVVSKTRVTLRKLHQAVFLCQHRGNFARLAGLRPPTCVLRGKKCRESALAGPRDFAPGFPYAVIERKRGRRAPFHTTLRALRPYGGAVPLALFAAGFPRAAPHCLFFRPIVPCFAPILSIITVRIASPVPKWKYLL
ncbi:MAG: hypothetical protein RSG50_07265, partial [Clostridia bacterium]